MNTQTRNAIETIFSNAIIIDIDMCSWYNKISLYCDAQHMHDITSYDRGPLFRVDFIQPTRFDLDFSECRQANWEPDGHPPWRISLSSMRVNDGVIDVFLRDSNSYPKIQIACKDILVFDCDQKLFKQIDPESGVLQRSIGFHRPSIERINTIVRAGRKDKRQ